jgi:hypothetical protein
MRRAAPPGGPTLPVRRRDEPPFSVDGFLAKHLPNLTQMAVGWHERKVPNPFVAAQQRDYRARVYSELTLVGSGVLLALQKRCAFDQRALHTKVTGTGLYSAADFAQSDAYVLLQQVSGSIRLKRLFAKGNPLETSSKSSLGAGLAKLNSYVQFNSFFSKLVGPFFGSAAVLKTWYPGQRRHTRERSVIHSVARKAGLSPADFEVQAPMQIYEWGPDRLKKAAILLDGLLSRGEDLRPFTI